MDVFEILPENTAVNNDFIPVLRKHSLKESQAGTVSRILSSPYYVLKDDSLDDLIAEMNQHSALLAIGVTDESGKPVGVILRRELFNLLGKSYGKNFVEHKTVESVMKEGRKFPLNQNIYTVSDSVQNEIKSPEIQYFLAVETNGKFAGVFSTRDVLMHLAAITRRDFDLARDLQKNIVKETSEIKTQNFELLSCNKMAFGVGGDFYSAVMVNPGIWHICIADVSGKGMAASLITAMLSGILKSYDPKKGLFSLIKNLNRSILDTFEGEKYLTGIFMEFNEVNGNIKLYDMGHSHVQLMRKGKFYNIVTSDANPPIGILPDITPVSNILPLQNEDTLVLITDGIIEQNNENRQEYGTHKFAQLLTQKNSKNLEEIRSAILTDIKEFMGNQNQRDDLTFLLLRYKAH